MKRFTVKGLVFLLVLVFSLMSAMAVLAQSKDTPGEKININTASAKELQKLPQVGVVVAQRIVDYREEHGKFTKIEDIMKVRGIGEKTFLKLKPLITVE